MVAVIVAVGVEPGAVRLGGTATTVAAKKVGLAKPTVGSAQYTTTVAMLVLLPPPELRTSTMTSSGKPGVNGLVWIDSQA
jgi:hypothetical protein